MRATSASCLGVGQEWASYEVRMRPTHRSNEAAMSRPTLFSFTLYVAGDTQNSVQAIANLNAICAEHLAGRHETEIVDVFREPERALTDGILMTPTLMKLSP